MRDVFHLPASNFFNLTSAIPNLSMLTGSPPWETLINTDIPLFQLPREIIIRIIFFVYRSKSEIWPFIITCRKMYSNFIQLVYLTKVIELKEYKSPRLQMHDDINKARIQSVLVDNRFIIPPHITVLKLNSQMKYRNFPVPSNFFKKLKNSLPIMQNLIILQINANNPFMLFEILKFLPPNLKSLTIGLNFSKRMFKHFDDSTLDSILNNRKGEFINSLSSLEYFSLRSMQVELISKHFHPELGKYDYLTHQEINSQKLFNHLIYGKLNSHRQNYIEKKYKIGQILFNFLELNGENLLKLEFSRFDLSLIFSDPSHRPFTFPKLRVLYFDNTSRIHMQNWLSDFQIVNKEKTSQDQEFGCPLLVLYDQLSQFLYYKQTNLFLDSDANVHRELLIWSKSEHVKLKYDSIKKQRNLIF